MARHDAADGRLTDAKSVAAYALLLLQPGPETG
jgi:hypothetical protein